MDCCMGSSQPVTCCTEQGHTLQRARVNGKSEGSILSPDRKLGDLHFGLRPNVRVWDHTLNVGQCWQQWWPMARQVLVNAEWMLICMCIAFLKLFRWWLLVSGRYGCHHYHYCSRAITYSLGCLLTVGDQSHNYNEHRNGITLALYKSNFTSSTVVALWSE